MTWSSWFRINSRMASRLKVGRLFLGGDAAHIHSPAGAQGMNTGIQDMINLAWKIALVVKGQAPATLLDTYEQDRLPVMRNVLFKTENLTEIIGSENPVARSLFNHLGPWVGGASIVQENSTARMAQVALGYRESTLSDNHAHSGALKAGDRLPPDLTVRRRDGQSGIPERLGEILDPLGFIVLVAHAHGQAESSPALTIAAEKASVPLPIIELEPAEQKAYVDQLGGKSEVFLVRPDGYIALAAPMTSAPKALATFIERWLTTTGART
jgi:hypothetical protein